MKRITLLLVLITYFISAQGSVRICKTNWPDMNFNCTIATNNEVYLGLILESTYSNSSTFSNFKVVINGHSIPISLFDVSGPYNGGYYKYYYIYSEQVNTGDTKFKYKIDYRSLPSNVFKVYSYGPSITETKNICNPDGEYVQYFKLSNGTNNPIASTYPNPFNNELTIEYKVHSENDRMVDIIDLHGKVLLSNIQKDTEISNLKQKIDTSDLAPGIYYCRISNNLTSSIIKLIKTK